MYENLTYCVIGAVLFSAAYFLNAKWSVLFRWIEWPDARDGSPKRLIVGPSFVVVGLVSAWFLINTISPWYLLSCVILISLGIYEDRKPLPKLDRYFFQSLACGLSVFLDPFLHKSLVASVGIAGSILIIGWLVLFLNAMKHLDGADGLIPILLLGGIGAVGLFSQLSLLPEPFWIIDLFLLGSLVPFIYLNLKKKNAILGYTGSYFLAFLIATSHLSMPLACPNGFSRLSLPLLTFMVPSADSLSSFIYSFQTFFAPWRRKHFGHINKKLSLANVSRPAIFFTAVVIQSIGITLGYFILKAGVLAELGFIVAGAQVILCVTLILLMERYSRKTLQSYLESVHSQDWIFLVRFQVNNFQGKPATYMSLRRLESQIFAEIRMTDLCYLENPNRIFIALRTPKAALDKILLRLVTIFKAEKIDYQVTIEEAKFTKITDPLTLKKSA